MKKNHKVGASPPGRTSNEVLLHLYLQVLVWFSFPSPPPTLGAAVLTSLCCWWLLSPDWLQASWSLPPLVMWSEGWAGRRRWAGSWAESWRCTPRRWRKWSCHRSSCRNLRGAAVRTIRYAEVFCHQNQSASKWAFAVEMFYDGDKFTSITKKTHGNKLHIKNDTKKEKVSPLQRIVSVLPGPASTKTNFKALQTKPGLTNSLKLPLSNRPVDGFDWTCSCEEPVDKLSRNKKSTEKLYCHVTKWQMVFFTF